LTINVVGSTKHGPWQGGRRRNEYSWDCVPLDAAILEVLSNHRRRHQVSAEDWLFANPSTGRPYHQDSIQQGHIRQAGKSAGLGMESVPP
jgi:hypothetical protein